MLATGAVDCTVPKRRRHTTQDCTGSRQDRSGGGGGGHGPEPLLRSTQEGMSEARSTGSGASGRSLGVWYLALG